MAFIISAFLKQDCSYKNKCGIRLHDANLEHSLMNEKNRCPFDWHSYFYVLASQIFAGWVLVQTILTLRDYIKINMKNLCTKITYIVRLIYRCKYHRF